MGKTLYAVFLCDNSRQKPIRLFAICTTINHLRDCIAEGIRTEVFAYPRMSSCGTPYLAWATEFKKDWRIMVQGGENPLDLIREVECCFVEAVPANKI